MLERVNSRVESLDNLSMDNFWLEVENIKQSTEAEQEECSLAEVKTPEGRLLELLLLNMEGGRGKKSDINREGK